MGATKGSKKNQFNFQETAKGYGLVSKKDCWASPFRQGRPQKVASF